MEKYDVIAIGEYLIDFSPSGKGKMENPLYEMNPGGAPSNCLAACSALGGKSSIIAAVGDDLFGKFLLNKAKDAGIDTSQLQTVEENTTLVFVSLDERGEREFAFVRDPGADTQITADKIDCKSLENTRFLHFGSLSLTHEPAKTATEFAVKYAKSNGAAISYDPNYRAPLWTDSEQARERMLWGVRQADIVKMSEVELEFLTGYGLKNIENGIAAILSTGVKELYITLGRDGAYYANEKEIGKEEGFPVDAVDTTGCGDAFTGAILYQRCHEKDKSMREKVRFANAVGALCALQPGGICAMPKLMQVTDFLRNRS